jgi:rubredoxin
MHHTIKINLLGGIVSPGDLYDILDLAGKCGVEQVRFGNRQQLLFRVEHSSLEDLREGFLLNGVGFEADEDCFPNIMSSYVTDEVFNSPNWLREGVYKDILNSFTHRPRLKINIADYYQDLIPFFTGNLNFISSEISNFWYLCIRFPRTNIMYNWPCLVYSEDIEGISRVIEEIIYGSPGLFFDQEKIDGRLLYDRVTHTKTFLQQPCTHRLIHTDFQLPYYEGFNRYRENKWWLGIYRRKEEYPVPFLKEICRLCLKTRIGQLYTTAWKSVVIKNIDTADRPSWSSLLNKYRVNVRHAANELNWQTGELCEEAIRLKQELVKQFEEADLRTYRLCFAIKTHPKSGLFGSIVIRRLSAEESPEATLYEVQHTRDYNPNTKDYVMIHPAIPYDALGPALIAICEEYFDHRNSEVAGTVTDHEDASPAPGNESGYCYQCKNCLSVYDEQFGDSNAGVAPGTPFHALTTYTCSTCEAEKEDFMAVERSVLLNQ